MNAEKFQDILERRIYLMREILVKKAAEYSRGKDRLHNFKRVAGVKGCTVAQANIDGFCKHLVSILDMVDDLGVGKTHSFELWEEKLGDAINYLVLLEAIIKENSNANKSDFSGVASESDRDSVLPLGSGPVKRSTCGNAGWHSRSLPDRSGLRKTSKGDL